MRPKTRLRQYRLALEEVGHPLEPGIVSGILQGRDVPEMNGWGLFWLATTKSKYWRGAFRTAVHFALISQQSGQFVYVWIHAHHLTRYSTMFSVRLYITINIAGLFMSSCRV